MKKILLIALILTLAMGTAIAKQQRGSGSPGARGGDPVAHLTEQLGLDADQVAQITAIFEETRTLRDEERQKSREIFCEIRTDSHGQVVAVLTPEQLALFEEMQQNRDELKRAINEARAELGHGGGDRERLGCDG